MFTPIPIGTMRKNAGEEIRVSLDEFKGHILCNVRVFGNFGPDGAFLPTKKGLSISLDSLPELLALLKEADYSALALGLYSPAVAEEVE